MKTFEIVAGTYEEFLIGYDFFDVETRLVQSFASHDHSASVRCLATSSPYVATGGADDRIIVYDFKLRKEQCMLSHHNSTINCLNFTSNHSHLLSASQDGVLAITRVGNWQLEKLWTKAHKGSAILDIAVHSTGKLALTLGEDYVLRTWNLVKGRQAYAVNLKNKSKDAKSLFKILWAEDGIRFILMGGKYTEIWSIETGGMIQAIEHDAKISSCIWYSSNKILVGYEDGNLCLVKLSSLKKKIYKIHEDRIKVLDKYEKWVVSGSSSGEIKVFNKNFDEICKINTGCRLTSLVIIPPISIKKEEKCNNVDDSIDDQVEEVPLKKKRKKKHDNSEYVLIDDTRTENDISIKPLKKKKKVKCKDIS